MAYALIASTAKTGSVTTDAIDTTGANLIVIGLAGDITDAPTDSKGNTWSVLGQGDAGADGTIVLTYYSFNPTVGSGHTFTWGEDYGVIMVSAWSGAASTPFDQENDAGTISGTSLAPGSVTPTQDNELLVTCLVAGKSNSSHAVNGGFTISNSVNGVN